LSAVRGRGVLHSALSDVERARNGGGAERRSARRCWGAVGGVIAPLENIGLIIVDEEQKTAIKQEETARYHGRDVAIVRAKMEGALALLVRRNALDGNVSHATEREI